MNPPDRADGIASREAGEGGCERQGFSTSFFLPGLAPIETPATVWPMSKPSVGCALTILLAILVARAESTNRFGFSGPEVFPIDWGLTFLRYADFDGDGLNDLIVVNNARSKITLMYNQTGKTNALAPKLSVGRKDINELPADARFRIESIASEKRISSLAVADLNGDRRPDLVYFGEPRELILQLNQGANGWSQPKRWPLEDGLLDGNALSTGDVDGDGRVDVLLLAEKHLYVLRQQVDGTLAEPDRVPYAGVVKAAQVLDIDGDQREDLLLINWDSANPFRFRLLNPQRQLGPEIHLELPAIRSYWAEDLDGDHRTEVMTIALKSGRAAVSNFKRKSAEPLLGDLKDGQFAVFPLNRTEKSRRGLTWARLTKGAMTDLVVADPDGGQLLVYAQQADGTLAAARTFPTLTGVSEIAAADWDADARSELFLLSTDEKQIGVTSVEAGGRIGFPRPLPLPGRPLVMAVGELSAGEHVVATILDREDRRELFTINAKGQTNLLKLSDTYKANPTSLTFHDANQDGMMDLVLLTPYEKIKILVQNRLDADRSRFEEVDVTQPGGTAEQPWMSVADVDGDGKSELLFAQKNFVRAVVLAPDAGAKGGWTLAVRDQINGASSNSKIVGAAALPAGEGQKPALFLLDAERKALTLCQRDASGVWQPSRNLPLPMSDFFSLGSVTFGGGTAHNTLTFVGGNSVAWKRFSGDIWQFEELDGYETPIKDGYLHDVVSGDLNQDGRKDLVFLEVARSYLDLVTFEAPHKLVPANRWQVFEERSFRQRRGTEAEPREALVIDLTGDGKNDLVVLVHDRILLYPQE